jgi:hypothetical protein
MDAVKSIEECPPFPSINNMEFRHCKGLPGYAVTNTGEIWSCRAGGRDHKNNVRPWKKRKGSRTSGYPSVGVSVNGKLNIHYIHRLVLEAFIGPCPDGMECRHLNGNKLDNRFENLCWGTSKDNKSDMICDNRYPTSRLSADQVVAIRELSGVVPQRQIAKMFGTCQGNVGFIIRGEHWKHL